MELVKFIVVGLGLTAKYTLAALLTDPRHLPQTQWDYIVVGAGTAGCVVANRLSENPKVKILVIEAGVQNTGPDASAIEVPFLVAEASSGTTFDWNYTTTPQAALNNRTTAYPRGFVLGGSSSTNYMAFTRGSSEEYNRLASISGDSGWSWRKIFPYALKNEKHVASADNHKTTGEYNPSVHGNGPLLTSLPGTSTDIDNRVLETTKELHSEFPFNLDMNAGNPLGVGWLQSTIGNSVRSSSATAYLSPALANRSNINLLTNTRVTRLIKTNNLSSRFPTFLGVEFAQTASGPRFTATAREEVILSAGSIGTPQILMLSGIGDQTKLSKLGIKTAVNLPDVGMNMQDHPFFALQWSVNSTKTFDSIVNNATAFSDAFAQYEATGQGIFANNAIANHIGFFRLAESSGILKQFGDPTAGPHSPHYEFAFINGFYGTTQTEPTTGNYFSAAVILVSPTSRGSVTLASDSPFDHPLIDPALLATSFDQQVVVEAVEALQRFISASPWKGYIKAPYGGSANATTRDGILEYARNSVISIRHPMGTAAMSQTRARAGVVDAHLLVKGVEGVRIVDASVIPGIAAHPQAAVYIIAERAADLIKAAR
ncbi:aryl-alcohol oxidase-like protein [Rickenella mellea]|uniref:Aryl-alcohol oxidase-like protein n=1 Tax=Rickenella mellea TaxID=50990 RepID=A0A4Y7PY46_9AGAM|nr:aryl-alcohol oxidase-like protein [Rickenella mellea]